MFQTFRTGEQLDREQIFGKLDNRSQFQRPGHAHRDVVFFSARRTYIIDA